MSRNLQLKKIPYGMPGRLVVITALCAVILSGGCRFSKEPPDQIYQVSTFKRLEAGGYGGFVPIKKIAQNGDFGIGTTDGLDGELVVRDGRFWSVKTSGKILSVGSGESSPFAEVKFFKPEITYPVRGMIDKDKLLTEIETRFGSKDAIYAVRIDGVFESVKTRSVPKQTEPYPPLAEVIKNQTVFEAAGVMGSVIGYYFPDDMSGVAVAGWHLHFISNDASFGGHLLGFRINTGTISIDRADSFLMSRPPKTEPATVG